MILNVAEAAHPPRNLRPRTLLGTLALAMEPLEPGQQITLGGIVTLSGTRATYNAIRGSIYRAGAPGRTHSIRALRGGMIQIWRNT